MELTILKAEARTATGSNNVRRLRAEGKVPATVYGGDGSPATVQVQQDDIERELRAHRRTFKLDLSGAVEGVYLQDVQFDCLSDEALHLDFRRIDLDKEMQVDITLAFAGHAKGVAKGGTLIKDMTHVPLNARPDAVPYEIEVAVAEIDLGDAIRAKDLPLPEGCTLNCDPETLVCHMPGGE